MTKQAYTHLFVEGHALGRAIHVPANQRICQQSMEQSPQGSMVYLTSYYVKTSNYATAFPLCPTCKEIADDPIYKLANLNI